MVPLMLSVSLTIKQAPILVPPAVASAVRVMSLMKYFKKMGFQVVDTLAWAQTVSLILQVTGRVVSMVKPYVLIVLMSALVFGFDCLGPHGVRDVQFEELRLVVFLIIVLPQASSESMLRQARATASATFCSLFFWACMYPNSSVIANMPINRNNPVATNKAILPFCLELFIVHGH